MFFPSQIRISSFESTQKLVTKTELPLFELNVLSIHTELSYLNERAYFMSICLIIAFFTIIDHFISRFSFWFARACVILTST